MTAYGYGAGAFRTPAVLYGKAGGVWQVIQQAYAKVAGVWTLVYSAFTPFSTDYTPGTYDIAVPNGASRLQLSLAAAGGQGGSGYTFFPDGPDIYGGGGGSGGVIYHDIAISPSDWGQNIHLVVGNIFAGNGQDSTISGLFGLAVGGGSLGGSNDPGYNPGGPGGSATGGNVANYPGFDGDYGTQFNIGSGAPSADGGSYGSGGPGHNGFGSGGDGNAGHAHFDWS